MTRQQHEVRISDEWKDSGSKPIGFDLMEDAILFGFFYPAMRLTLLAFCGRLPADLEPFLLLAGMFASTVNRRRNRLFGLFLLTELAIGTGIALLPRLFGGGIVSLILFSCAATAVLIAAVHRFFTGLNKDDPRYDPETATPIPYLGLPTLLFGAGLLYVTYLVSLFMNRPQTLPCLLCFLASFALFEIYRHQCGTAAVLQGDGHYRKPDTRRFRHLNRLIAGLIALLILLGGLFSYRLYTVTGLKAADQAIVAMLRRNPDTSDNVRPNFTVSAPAASKATRPKLPQSTGPTQPALVFLGQLLKIVSLILAVVVGVAAVMAAAGLLVNLLRYRRTEAGTQRQSLFSLQDTTGRVRDRIAHSRLRTLFTGTSNNGRIRRLYFRFIRRRIRGGLPVAASDTPADILRKLETRPDLRDMTSLYEKARYSRAECTDAEVARMRADTRPN